MSMSKWKGLFADRERMQLQAQKKEIEEITAAQNGFLSRMSHEIRTPINTIIGLNEMILREDISDEVADDAKGIQAASRMLLATINDVLDMSKMQAGEMKLTPVNYKTGDMLSEIVGMLWRSAEQKGLIFKVDVASDLPSELVGDDVRIKQVLINVINNAIKYTHEGSVTLSIQCEKIDTDTVNVVYSVTDTGMGIKKESIPYLFTAFRRVDEEKNRYIEGTGLGLSIVKQLVDLMGGKITVNSVYTKGSTFVIEIPQKSLNDVPIGEYDVHSGTRHADRQEYHQSFEAPEARVLIVDDNKSNRIVIKKLLRDTKIELDMAESGAEALKLTQDIEYHLILMDHLMPEMDGIECLHKIREQTGGQCRDTRIAVLTANVGSEIRQLYQKEGFDGYLVKPINGRELEAAVAGLLPESLVHYMGGAGKIVEDSMEWLNYRKKKANVIITTESVADLPKDILDKYHIEVMPHKVKTAEGVFRDGIEIETRGLLNYMSDENNNPSTVAPSVEEHEEFFARQLQRANHIIHISISSKVAKSGYHAALEAARAFDNVTVVDSGHLSSGQGLMVMHACMMAQEDKDPTYIVEELKFIRSQIQTSFIVDNLDYMARAGQIGRKVANFTKAFMIHPVMMLSRGRILVDKAYIGTHERAWRAYIGEVLSHPARIDKSILFVTYVGMSSKELEYVRAEIEKRVEFERVIFQKASPAIAVNCGPGTFGLLFKRL